MGSLACCVRAADENVVSDTFVLSSQQPPFFDTTSCRLCIQDEPLLEKELHSGCSDGSTEEVLCFSLPNESRRGAISAEAFGAFNQWQPPAACLFPKTEEQHAEIKESLTTRCPLVEGLDASTLDCIVDMTEIKVYPPGANICGEEDGIEYLYILINGSVEIGWRTLKEPPDKTTQDACHLTLCRSGSEFNAIFGPGHIFGNCNIFFASCCDRIVSALQNCVVGRLMCQPFLRHIVCSRMLLRATHEGYIRAVKMFETFNADVIARIADVIEAREYRKSDVIIEQDSVGDELFLVSEGECTAEVSTGKTIQQHRRYFRGNRFGELGFIKPGKRNASVIAISDKVQVLSIHRTTFETMFGELDLLQKEHYMSDPRKIIKDFYQAGDEYGPLGAKRPGECSGPRTEWFAVFRPTSNDAIARILEGIAVGKGLNVKGKSAKKGILSGFVPFLQIHDNIHKLDLDPPKPSAMFRIFFQTQEARVEAFNSLLLLGRVAPPSRGVHRESSVKKSQFVPDVSGKYFWGRLPRFPTVRDPGLRGSLRKEPKKELPVKKFTRSLYERLHSSNQCARPIVVKQPPPQVVMLDDEFSHLGFGIEVSERLVHEAFLKRPNLESPLGWDTGRASEPDFMNMNLNSLRQRTTPEVVLYQFDKASPMNPHGLVMAYAENVVKPVVSDFDLFLVGGLGMSPDALPEDQQELAIWSLDRTLEILKDSVQNIMGWNRCWLKTLRVANSQGFHPVTPPYGNGDDTSYRLTRDVIEATKDSGAVRHGAECFNFYFPQELDKEYLIIWEKFDTWDYKDEVGLRKFLFERMAEGYTFPIHPVWPIRDPGWYEVYTQLKQLKPIFSDQVDEKVEAIHKQFPSGFRSLKGEEEDLSGVEQVDLIMHHSSLWLELRDLLRVALDMPYLGSELPRRFQKQPKQSVKDIIQMVMEADSRTKESIRQERIM